MNFLRNWIRNVILVVLLAHFIELLLPENELKKYVKVVIGFFVIIVILTPLLKVTTQELPGLDFNLVTNRRPSFADIVDQGQQLRKKQQQEARQDYRRKLSQQIEAVTKLNSRLTDVQVKIKLANNNNLQSISIIGSKKEVTTTKTNGSSQQQKAQVNYRREKRLQDIVATLYGLDLNQVEVKLK